MGAITGATGHSVAIYARKSTVTESKSKSVDEQIEYGRHFARSIGYSDDCIVVYAEPEGFKGDWWWQDVEGKFPKPTRPELGRLVRDINSGRIGGVLAWSSDRLYRDSGICDALVKLFRAKGVKYYLKEVEQDIRSASGLYGASTEAAANQMYKDKISEDIKRDHQCKAEMGKFSRNPSCFGFRSMGRDSQAVRPIPEELAVVNRIFRLFVYGEGTTPPLGTSGIAKRFMAEGVTLAVSARGHKAKDPRQVHVSQIETILKNCMYVGRWRHNGTEYSCDRLLVIDQLTGETATAVPMAIFDLAQAKFASRTRFTRKRQSSTHLLSGLVVCGSCGLPMQSKQKKRLDGSLRLTYMCVPKHVSRRCSTEDVLGIQESIVDHWVVSNLLPFIQKELANMSREADSSVPDRIGQLRARLQIHKSKEADELPKLVGAMDSHQFALVASRFREERRAIENEIAVLEAEANKAPALAEDSLEEIQRLPAPRLRPVLQRLIKWIALTGQGVLVCTAWNTYIGGCFERGKLPGQRTYRTIGPAKEDASVDATSWLAHPERFIDGRRYHLGSAALHLTDNEIYPGIDEMRSQLEEMEIQKSLDLQ